MPVWLEKEALLVLHDRSLALHGGAVGIRDEGLLDSALVRPLNLHHYEGVSSVPELAAAYAVAISSNHPLLDGNKRAAFQALTLFLRLNGRRLTASQAAAARAILALAAGQLDLASLSVWVERNSGEV